jgi:uncharacterized protein (TIGR02145 family)
LGNLFPIHKAQKVNFRHNKTLFLRKFNQIFNKNQEKIIFSYPSLSFFSKITIFMSMSYVKVRNFYMKFLAFPNWEFVMETKRFLSLAAIFAIALAFFACSSDDPSPPPSEPSSDSSGGNQMVFCKLNSGTCSQKSFSTCMELVNAGEAQIVSNCNVEPPTPSSSSVAPQPPPSSSSTPPPPPPPSSSSSPSGGPCVFTATSQQAFCQWDTGCYAIDTRYSEPAGKDCQFYVDNCSTNGQLFVNVLIDGDGLKCANTGGTAYANSGTFTDSRGGGKTYKWVKIGTQTWMAENLNYEVSGSKCPNETAANCTTHGRQYNWTTAMAGSASTTLNPSKVQGICPTGWHLPSSAEWTTLQNYVGTLAGTRLKAKSGWNNSGNGTDNFGFTAMPSGYIEYGTINDVGRDFGSRGAWWTATQYNASYAYNRSMSSDGTSIYVLGTESVDYSMTKNNMLSVRCVKD